MADELVNQRTWTEMSFPVPWGIIQAKCWGSPTAKPFLGIHGWLDNANTFDKLVSFLPSDIYLVAIDLPGHGRSSDRSPGIPYNRIDWIVDMKWVVSQLGWKKFSLIGHSLGATVAVLYAGIFPEEIESAILIENRIPRFRDAGNTVVLAKAIEVLTSNSKKYTKTLKEFENIGAAAKRLMEVNKEITADDAKLLIKRSVAFPINPSNNEKIWIKNDQRLKLVEGTYKGCIRDFDNEEIPAILHNIQCNVLAIFGVDCHPSYRGREVSHFMDLIKRKANYYEQYDLTGNHFIHLNNPEIVAEKIGLFLRNCVLKSKL